jgi:phosphoribosylformylglycinamidine synthase subunit PurS
MKFKAEIDVMPLEALLDPQGKAVVSGLKNLGMNTVIDVRVGKHITLTMEARTKEEAEQQTDEACKKLLANPIMESYKFALTEI